MASSTVRPTHSLTWQSVSPCPAVVLTTIPGIFTDVYHEDVGIGGLHYIALGLGAYPASTERHPHTERCCVGLFVTTQINARIIDRVYRKMKARNGGVGKPEFRLRTSAW